MTVLKPNQTVYLNSPVIELFLNIFTMRNDYSTNPFYFGCGYQPNFHNLTQEEKKLLYTTFLGANEMALKEFKHLS